MVKNKRNAGPELPDVPESIEQDQAAERYKQKMDSNVQRAALANKMNQKEPLEAAMKGVNTEIENRPPEVILSRVSDVLTPERLKSLDMDDVELWKTGGSTIMETNKGLREYKGDNEFTRMSQINLLINATAEWEPESVGAEQSLLTMEKGKVVLNRSLLEEALGYVSAKKRHTSPERTAFFENYKEVLLDLIEAAGTPRDEFLYAQKYGSVAAEQIVQRHCPDTGSNTKEAWKSIGVAMMGILFAVNAFSDVKNGKFRVFTFVTLAGLAGLVGGSYKTDIFGKGTGFTEFCRKSLSREKAEDIFALKPIQINAMLKYFKSQAGEKVGEESIEALSNPKNRKGDTDMARAVPADIAKIFVGLSGAQAHTNLQNLIKMKTGPNREVTLNYIDATHKDGGQTETEIDTLLNQGQIAK